MEPEFNADKYWFGLRKGFRGGSSRPSLLIVDRSGVYSSVHRRYIRKTPYHRYRALAVDLAPVVKAYRSLQKLGMSSWKEHDPWARKEIAWWKHRVMDVYWDAAPEKHKAGAIERYFRARYQRGMVYPSLAIVVGVLVVSDLWRLMLPRGSFQVGFDLVWPLAFFFLVWIVLGMTERFVTITWSLSRSQIHNVLEFELANN